jgi:hypothetical protein
MGIEGGHTPNTTPQEITAKEAHDDE